MALGAALAGGAVSTTQAHHPDDFQFKIDFRTGCTEIDRRVWVEPCYENRTTQVWVEPAYTTVPGPRVWVEPVYKTVFDRVWREPVTREEKYEVLVPAGSELREIVTGCVVRKQWVFIPAHYVTKCRQVVVSPGHSEDIARQELVTAGHWQCNEQRVLLTAGHFETRIQRVCLSEGHWDVRPLISVR